MREQERILIFELNWMGDILFSVPFLRAVREKYPNAYIACVVVPRYMDLLVNNPWINDVHVLDDNNRISSLGEKIAFINMIKREKYNIAFFLKPSKTKTLAASFAGIKRRIGFMGKKALLTDFVEKPSSQLHRADQILALAGPIGVTQADGTYESFFSPEEEESAANILHDSGGGLHRIIGINPGGNWDAKRWPLENFILLSKKILEYFPDVEIMVTGAQKDTGMAGKIVDEAGSKKCYSVAGKTKLNELAALFKRCEVVISADSGPLHLASSTGVTTVGLFGPTSPKITGQRGRGKNIVIHKEIGCGIPCYQENCTKLFECMKLITPRDVMEVLKKEL